MWVRFPPGTFLAGNSIPPKAHIQNQIRTYQIADSRGTRNSCFADFSSKDWQWFSARVVAPGLQLASCRALFSGGACLPNYWHAWRSHGHRCSRIWPKPLAGDHRSRHLRRESLRFVLFPRPATRLTKSISNLRVWCIRCQAGIALTSGELARITFRGASV
jgi:hypothetical protein